MGNLRYRQNYLIQMFRDKTEFLRDNFIHTELFAIALALACKKCVEYPVAGPGFPRGGGANSQKCYYFAICLPKTA